MAINALPALLTEIYDGWIIRFSSGYTYRGNSVSPLYASTLSLEAKVVNCEKKFFDKSLPCVFKMTEIMDTKLDKLLKSRGYRIQKKADIMEMPVNELYEDNLNEVVCLFETSDKWLDDFMILNGTDKEPMKGTAKKMLKQIENPVICAAIYKNNEMAACGLGVYEDGQIGLYDIRALEKYRKNGYGTCICKRIINEGIKLGAHTSYLQVASQNDIAIKMYSKIGFKKVYTYWYRVLSNNQDILIDDDGATIIE